MAVGRPSEQDARARVRDVMVLASHTCSDEHPGPWRHRGKPDWCLLLHLDVAPVRRWSSTAAALERRGARDSDLDGYRQPGSHGGMPLERSAKLHRGARAAAHRRRQFMYDRGSCTLLRSCTIIPPSRGGNRRVVVVSVPCLLGDREPKALGEPEHVLRGIISK